MTNITREIVLAFVQEHGPPDYYWTAERAAQECLLPLDEIVAMTKDGRITLSYSCDGVLFVPIASVRNPARTNDPWQPQTEQELRDAVDALNYDPAQAATAYQALSAMLVSIEINSWKTGKIDLSGILPEIVGADPTAVRKGLPTKERVEQIGDHFLAVRQWEIRLDHFAAEKAAREQRKRRKP